MNDPHVESLRYRLEANDDYARFENPPPLEHETDAYRFRLADGVLTVEMKEHHAAPASARQRVEHDLKAWGLDAALEHPESRLKFVYNGASVLDRDPPVDGQVMGTGNILLGSITAVGVGTIGRVTLRGGLGEARKLDANATLTPLTTKEHVWVRATLKRLIRRKAEYDADPAAAGGLPIITMACLPEL
jgi:hypothetical protein